MAAGGGTGLELEVDDVGPISFVLVFLLLLDEVESVVPVVPPLSKTVTIRVPLLLVQQMASLLPTLVKYPLPRLGDIFLVLVVSDVASCTLVFLACSGP